MKNAIDPGFSALSPTDREILVMWRSFPNKIKEECSFWRYLRIARAVITKNHSEIESVKSLPEFYDVKGLIFRATNSHKGGSK